MTTLPDCFPTDGSYSEHNWRTLANCWHPVALSSEVGDQPFGATLLDVPLVIYRSVEGITVARRHCPHRGADLTQGWIAEDRLVCAYHGLRFNAAGQCTLIPAVGPDMKVPERLCLTTFPARERYGLIWTCLAPEPRFPLPEWPALEDPDFQVGELSTVWEVSAARHTENFLDIAHAAWVHADTFAPRDYPEIPKYEVETRDSGLYYSITTLFRGGNTFEYADTVEEAYSEYTLTLPYAIGLKVVYPAGTDWIFDVASPVSARKIRVFMRKARNFDKDKPIDDWLDFQHAVNAEDKAVVENQRPPFLPLDLSSEFHIRADSISVAYRRQLAGLALEANGGY